MNPGDQQQPTDEQAGGLSAARGQRPWPELACNHVGLALLVTNARRECVYLNPAAEQLLGYRLGELAGRPLHDVVHPVRADGRSCSADHCSLEQALAGERVGGGENWLVRKDGSHCPVAFVVKPLPTTDPRGGMLIEARDIASDQRREHERNQSELARSEAHDQLRSTFSELQRAESLLRDESDVVETINRVGQTIAAELDLQKLVQAVTDATTRLSGAQFGAFFYNVTNRQGESYMLYTLSGVPIELFSKFPMPRNTDVFAPTFRGEGVVRSADIRRDPRYGRNEPYFGMPQGHLPVASYLAVPVISRTGEVLGGLFLGHERTGVFSERAERIVVGIAAQAAVAIDNARLYTAEQAARLEKEELLAKEQEIRAELETSNRMKDEFLATLSHELRTPLNAVLGYATLLQKAPLNESERRDALQTIERNARLQAQLIEDLLDMNRIVSGKIRLDVQLVDLPAAIEAALDTVWPSAEARDLRIQRLIDPLAGPVKGDPARIQQVVWNLLSNAVKFTPKGGTIQVLLERVNSHVEISVIDNGVGIAPDFLPHVFDRFRQADGSTTRRQGGLGLGLSIVKQLVELHGGTVRAKSPGVGMGATFVIALPVSPVQSDHRERRTHPKAQQLRDIPCEMLLENVRVLVVDDEPDACHLVKRILEDCKAHVATAGSAAEAIECLKQARFDVLVSDIGMPGEDGYDLIKKVRALGAERGGNVPAVALTAFARSEDRTRAALAGFQTHLSKPVEMGELIAVVANLAGRTG